VRLSKTQARKIIPEARSHTARGVNPAVLPSVFNIVTATAAVKLPDRRASLLLRKHAPRCNIGRGIRHSEEDDDLAAWLALESATMFFHWFFADAAQGCHRIHGGAANQGGPTCLSNS
jgi:hypothetical protein